MNDAPRTMLDQPLMATPEETRSAQITIVEFCEAHKVPRDDLKILLEMVTGKAPDAETKGQLRRRREELKVKEPDSHYTRHEF